MSARHQGHGGAGGHGPGLSFGTENVQFSFSTDQASVTAMTVSAGTRTRSVDISDDSFKTTAATDASGAAVVSAVERTQTSDHATHTTLFTDTDSDGQFAAVFDIGVITSTDTLRLETHSFSFAADGSVSAETETRGDCTSTGTPSDSVDYQVITLDGDTYVVKTVALANDDYRFEVSRDDNGDGTWTTVAEGHVDATAAATYLDDGALDLAGVQGYLEAAAAVVG